MYRMLALKKGGSVGSVDDEDGMMISMMIRIPKERKKVADLQVHICNKEKKEGTTALLSLTDAREQKEGLNTETSVDDETRNIMKG